MDLETYEETRLGRDESWAKYLKEGQTVALVVWNDKVSSTATATMCVCSHASTDCVSMHNSRYKVEALPQAWLHICATCSFFHRATVAQ